MSKIRKIKQEFKYRTTSKTRYDAHSPFLYNFIENVVRDNGTYYWYSPVERLRERMLSSKEIITIEDFGAGSKVFKSNERKVSDIARYSVKQKKYGQLLFRMVNYFDCKTTLELGTSLGITTAYLAAANQTGTTVSIEGDSSIHRIAKHNLKTLHLKRNKLILGQFDTVLEETITKIPPLDLVFIDGHHAKEPTLRYFDMCLTTAHENTIFVFDDIHWSEEMETAWKSIIQDERTTLCLDFNTLGIVFLKPELSAQDFVIRF